MCVHMSPGTEGVVDAKLVPVLVGRLLKEEDEIKVRKNMKLFQHADKAILILIKNFKKCPYSFCFQTDMNVQYFSFISIQKSVA